MILTYDHKEQVETVRLQELNDDELIRSQKTKLFFSKPDIQTVT